MITNKRQYEFERVLEYYGYVITSEKFKIVCPFHADKNASMLVELATGSFYCFGCQARGKAIDFVKRMENIQDDFQACLFLAKILNKSNIKRTLIKAEYKTDEQREHERKDNLIAAYNYYDNLSVYDWTKFEHETKDYMLARGFTPKTLNKFGCKLNVNKDYPIIFPILDNGKFKGYVCRTVDYEIQQKRKYLYNTGFKRALCLCGDYRSKTVMVVEGYLDYLKAKQFGVKNVVALLGWKATDVQISKLKKNGVKQIICALDNDECGKKGAKYLRNYFNVTRFVFPKSIKDIGEMNIETFNNQKNKTLEIIKMKRNDKKWE